MPLSLSTLSFPDSLELGSRLRAAGESATSMEEVATAAVRTISEETHSERDEPGCALVRCFLTLRRSRLPTRLAEIVASRAADDDPDDQFLVLLATEGVEPNWCDRRRSRQHQIIPLADPTGSMTFPMVTRMFRQFGCPLPAQAAHREAFVEPEQHAFGVFHVENAGGSSGIPDQDFISRYGVASVVGVGGRLPTGDVFALLVFSRDPIDRTRATFLQPWALSITLAFLPVFDRVFAGETPSGQSRVNVEDLLRFELTTMRSLLELQEALVSEDFRRQGAPAGHKPDIELTPRERTILRLVCTGATNKQIAANLDMSPGTVKWHVYQIFQKFRVTTRTGAAAAARERGFLQ